MEKVNYKYKQLNGQAVVTGPIELSITKLNIPSIIDGYPVIEIAENAFTECDQLKTVTLPESVGKIGSFAFFNCKSLEEINLEKVSTIGRSAFQNCESMRKVILSNAMTRVESWAFYGCKNLKQIELGDNLTYIGHQAFARCENMEEVCISGPQNIILGHEVFFNIDRSCKFRLPFLCNKELVFPDTTQVEHFDFSSPLGFVSYNGIRYEEIDEQRLAVGDNSKFSGMAYIYPQILFDGINYSVVKINEKAFYGCNGITSIVIPSTVVEIGPFALSKCESLTSISVQNNMHYYSTEDSLALVDSAEKSIIAYAIGSRAVSFNVPSEIRKFEKYAMYAFKNLERITFNTSEPPFFDKESFNAKDKDGVLKRCTVFIASNLDEDARISYADALKLWWDDERIKIFGEFVDTETQIVYKVVNDVVKTAEVARNKNYASNEANVKAEVEYAGTIYSVVGIGKNAFWNNEHLEKIVLPDTILKIGEDSFNSCSIKEIVIPESVCEIGKQAFMYSSLQTVMFHSEKAPEMGKDAFRGMDACVAIIPAGEDAKTDYESKLNVWFEQDSIVSFGSFTDEKSKIAFKVIDKTDMKVEVARNAGVNGNVVIPASVDYFNHPYSVVKIGDKAFWNNRQLKKITLPETLIEIGDDSFNSCSIKEIVIPAGVRVIGKQAFMYSDLTSIRFTSDTPPHVGPDAFKGVEDGCVVHIPKKKQSEYSDVIQTTENLNVKIY